MDLIRLGDAAEAGTCYRCFRKTLVQDMDTIKFILVASIVLFVMAVLGTVFSGRKHKRRTS